MPESNGNLDEVIDEVTITLPIRLAMVETLIEMSGYGITYWASTARWDVDEKTYEVVPQAEFAEDYPAKTLDYKRIAWALGKIGYDPLTQVNSEIRGYATSAISQDDPGEIDATLADVVIQVAMFDEIVFG